MSKKVVFALIVILFVFTLVPKPAQGIDFTALPMPFNLQPGVRYQRGSMRFMYNNGYLSVWQAGGSTIYMFKWDDGWKEYKIVTHVIADLKKCIVSNKRIYREKGVFFRPVNTALKQKHAQSVSPVKSTVVSKAVFESNKINSKKPVFFMLTVLCSVRRFVKNKVPEAGSLPPFIIFSPAKACSWFTFSSCKPFLLEA